jgi:proline dehydrogenase
MAGLWQRTCIALARSEGLKARIQSSGVLSVLARRFVAGADVQAALDTTAHLREAGIEASLFYLGEYVADSARIARNIQEIQALMNAAARQGRNLHVSIDPSAVGYAVSDELGQTHARALGRTLRDMDVPGRKVLMLDMEDSSFVERTLALHDQLRDEGVPVAVTLQAYLRRSVDDARRLARAGGHVRIVKGAFAGQGDEAHTRRADVEAAFLRLVDVLLEPESLAAGAFSSYATHNEELIAAIAERLERARVPRERYEFEMLLGVRPPLQREQVAADHPLRLYVPYGTDWWPYTVRRIGENPANIRFLLMALFGR